MIGLYVRSCCSPYSFPSPLKGDAVAQSWCSHCRDGPWSCPPIMGQFHEETLVVKRGISSFHQSQVPLFHPGSGRGVFDPSVLALSSKSSMLMAVLQVVTDVLHLTKGFALVSNEIM